MCLLTLIAAQLNPMFPVKFIANTSSVASKENKQTDNKKKAYHH